MILDSEEENIPTMERSARRRQINHRPNRDFDVTLDHNRIAYELERNKNLEKDLMLAFLTPEAGPKVLATDGYNLMPPAYDMNVLASDALDDFLKSYFEDYAPMTSSVVGSSLEEGLNTSMGANVQVSRVTPEMWEEFTSTGRMNHNHNHNSSEELPPSSQKVEEIVLLEPHELTDGVGVKMYLDLYSKKKRLAKNKRATRLLKSCGIQEKRVFGPAVVVRYTEDSQGSMKPMDCGVWHVPELERYVNRPKPWEGMWISVASMQQNGRGALSARELADVTKMEQVVAYKAKGNQLFKEKHYRRAIEEYSKGLGILPNCTPLLLNRALMYMKLEEYEFAMPDLMKAVNLNSKDEKTMYRTAQCMSQQGNPKSSIEFMLMYLTNHRSAAFHQLLKDTYKTAMES